MRFDLMLPLLGLAAAAPSASRTQGDVCDCNGTRSDGTQPGTICGDWRLGPVVLPVMLPLGTIMSSYDRFGGLSPGKFLEKWTDEKGNYKYPPQNGFQLDAKKQAINGTLLLEPGTLVDRFGSEYGKFPVYCISLRNSTFKHG